MKKITAAMLIASMLAMPMAVHAEPEATVKSSQEFIVDKGEGKYQIYFYAEIENTGDEPIGSSEVLIDYTDANGNVFQNSRANSISPYNIAPGGMGFTSKSETIKEIEDPSVISDYNLTITTRKGSSEDLFIPAEYTLVTDPRDDYISTSVEFVLTTDRDEIYMWPSVHYGIYDQNDQIMYAGFVQAPDAGLIPGSQLLLVSNVSDDICRAWFQKDLVPTSVKFVCKTARKK